MIIIITNQNHVGNISDQTVKRTRNETAINGTEVLASLATGK
jgi:hypothetical protein